MRQIEFDRSIDFKEVPIMQVKLIAIDLAKSIFQVCGVNQAGNQVFNRQVRRSKLKSTIAQYPGVAIAMEACSGSNYWGRYFQQAGHKVLLIPPIHVKPFVKGNKNDRNDAFAITEAARRPNMRTVQPRSLEQTDLMLAHRVRERLVGQRNQLTNQIRGLLNEYGIVVAAGLGNLKQQLPFILEDGSNELTEQARHCFSQLQEEWRSLNRRIEEQEQSINHQAKAHEGVQRLQQIKGVGQITSTAAVAIIGDGSAFRNGRQCSANLGLIPKENSSGGKLNYGGITKRGNKYLRTLLVQGAWSILRYVDQSDDPLSRWAKQLLKRMSKQKVAVALANKLARIIWSMLYHQTDYRYGA